MKVKIVRPFYDKFNLSRLFNPGEVVDFEEKRAEDIVSRGLGEFSKENKAEKPEAPKVEEPAEPEAPKAEEPNAEPEGTAGATSEEPEAESEEAPAEPKKPGRKPRKKAE